MTYRSEFSAGCQMAPPSRWYPQGVFTVTWFRRTAAARVKKAAHVSFTICIHTFLNYIFFITLIMAVRSLKLLGGGSPRFRRAPCWWWWFGIRKRAPARKKGTFFHKYPPPPLGTALLMFLYSRPLAMQDLEPYEWSEMVRNIMPSYYIP